MKKIRKENNEILSVNFVIVRANYCNVDSEDTDTEKSICLQLYSKTPPFSTEYELYKNNKKESIYIQLNRALNLCELFEDISPESYINRDFCAVIEIIKSDSSIEILGIYDVNYHKEVDNGKQKIS